MDPNDDSKSRGERKRLKREYANMYELMTELFFRFDPVSLNYRTNTDEYEPEVSTILPRLKACGSAHDVKSVLHEEFCNWFSAEVAGPPDEYEALSVAVWTLWQKRAGGQSRGEVIP